MLDLDLRNRNALVCGSSQGIGLAAARELADLGATITMAARNEAALEAARATLSTLHGQKHHIMVADFTRPEMVQAAITNRLTLEGGPIEILVNNSGGPRPGPAHLATAADFEEAFKQHLICSQLLVQALLPGMRQSQYGRIINVISTSVKQVLPNLGVSNTVRAAVANWAKTLSRELAADGITVNNVLPGATETLRLKGIISNKAEKTGAAEDRVRQEMLDEIPAGRFGKPEEVAAMIAFLASPAAAYINGTSTPVDGGRGSGI